MKTITCSPNLESEFCKITEKLLLCAQPVVEVRQKEHGDVILRRPLDKRRQGLRLSVRRGGRGKN